MELTDISEEKIYSALRSLYRYREMTEEDAPYVLIEAESDLLKKRVTLLNAQEIFALVKLWPEYLTQQLAFDVIDNEQFDRYLRTIN